MDEEQILSALRAHVARHQSAADPENRDGDVSEAQAYQVPQLADIVPLPDGSERTALEPISIVRLAPIDRSRMSAISEEMSRANAEVGQLNPRNPGVLNHAIQAIKKAQQRFLNWYTRSLQPFHTAVGHAIREQGSSINSIQDQLLQLRDSSQDQLVHLRTSSHDQLLLLGTSVHDQLLGLRSSVQDVIQQMAHNHGQAMKSVHEELLQLRNSLQRIRVDQEALLASKEAIRATELATQEQQAPYVQLFRGLSPVLDLGSGRGEFLELLKHSDIPAYGVDSDLHACSAARAKQVEVVEGDLFDHLKNLPEGFLGGIFCARVIEYLPPHLHLELISLCSKALKQGGLIVIETVNPDSDFPFGRNSGTDPSHLRPVYPEILQSMLESSAFKDCKVCILAPKVVCATNSGDNAFAETGLLRCAPIIPGTSLPSAQAYAAIGWRS